MKPLLIVLSLTLTLFVTGQTRDTISSQLMQLKKPKHIVEKYVNFDVVKVFTLNHGRATIGGRQGFALSYSAQLLWPYSAFKHSVPIAFGVRFGASKFSLHHKELDFQNDDLVSIVENKSFKRTMQRTGHAGVIAMLVKQWKMQGITFMGGISAEYNMFSRLKVRSETGNSSVDSRKYINRFSYPLHLQISRSKRQFLSWGVFGTYDMESRFKGNAYNNLRQVTGGGFILALIL